jgi:TrmH family RNA methyltransferase
MGTILRTAYAAGVQAVLLTKGTVDPFNPKVVRAAMGAHLRLPIRYLDDAGAQDWLEGLDIWLAERGVGSAYYDVDWSAPVAVVIGSESHGPSDTLRSLATGEVYVPVKEETESLNAAIATGIILFEIARQRVIVA